MTLHADILPLDVDARVLPRRLNQNGHCYDDEKVVIIKLNICGHRVEMRHHSEQHSDDELMVWVSKKGKVGHPIQQKQKQKQFIDFQEK